MPRHPVSLAARFWRKVQRTESCWNWTGALRSGVGVLNVGGLNRYAHVLAWELTHSALPRGTRVRHLCGNRRCVRPEHLEPQQPKP